MNRIVPPEEAQRLLDLMPGDREQAEYTVFDRMARYTPCHETYAAAPDLAHTVIIRTNQVTELQKINGYKDRIIAQQEQQIKRLQNAVKDLLEDFNDADRDIFSERYIGQGEFEPSTIEDYGLTEKDMEP